MAEEKKNIDDEVSEIYKAFRNGINDKKKNIYIYPSGSVFLNEGIYTSKALEKILALAKKK